jgi:Fe-S-cluster containining protein
MDHSSTPWYRDGLAFECTRCGDCCTGAPGYVWVESDEIRRLAEHRGVDEATFARRFIRQVGDRLSLIERPNGDCVFWDRDEGCTVYEARPEQCRTWPFWPMNLVDRAAWRRVGRRCPGVDQGRLYTLDEIRDAAARTPE